MAQRERARYGVTVQCEGQVLGAPAEPSPDLALARTSPDFLGGQSSGPELGLV